MSLRNKKILFLVEGEKTEPTSIKNIASKMFSLFEEDYDIVSYKTTIYELYEELVNDPMMSLTGLLLSKNLITLEKGVLSKEAFSSIFLVFDFEPNYQKYSDDTIRNLLSFFDDETDNGKLYINYPMFESTFYIDDYDNPIQSFKPIPLSECYGKIFKKKTKQITCFKSNTHLYLDLSRNQDVLCSIRWNYIKAIDLSKKDKVDYKNILETQIATKNNSKTIIVLSTFVLLIIDYNPSVVKLIESN